MASTGPLTASVPAAAAAIAASRRTRRGENMSHAISAIGSASTQPRLWAISASDASSPAPPRAAPRSGAGTSRAAAR